MDTDFDGDGIQEKHYINGKDHSLQDLIIHSDGKLYSVGLLDYDTTRKKDFLVVSLNSDGTDNTTFGTGGYIVEHFLNDDQAEAIVFNEDQTKMYIIGTKNFTSTSSGIALLSLNLNGTYNNDFDSDGKNIPPLGCDQKDTATSLINFTSNLLLGGGYCKSFDGNFKGFYLTIGLDGIVAQHNEYEGLGLNFFDIVNNKNTYFYTTQIFSDGKSMKKVLYSGVYEYESTKHKSILFRFNENNLGVDSSWGNNGVVEFNISDSVDSRIRAMAIDSSRGRIYLGGRSQDNSNVHKFLIFAVNN